MCQCLLMVFTMLTGAESKPLDKGGPDDNVFLHDLNQCGPVALLTTLKLLGHDVTVADIEKVLPMDARPKTLAEVNDAAQSFGLSTLMLEWPKGKAPEFVAPAIIRLKTDAKEDGHFVVCLRSPSDPSTYLVYDYPSNDKPIRVPKAAFVSGRFSDHWNRIALHLSDYPKEIERLRANVEQNSFSKLIGSRSSQVVIGLAIIVLAMTVVGGRSRQDSSGNVEVSTTSENKETLQ